MFKKSYKDKKYIFIILFLFLQQLSVFAQTDMDSDGISDTNDLCPNTPIGTTVNAYGCPISKNNCDYNSSTFSFVSGALPANAETRYILADATDGKIVQISSTPTFTNLIGSKTYMVLSYSFINDGTLVNLNIGNNISQVNAACDDWSNALVVKVCSPFIESNNCDYNSSTFSLNTSSPPVGQGITTKYILTNSAGIIVKISDTPTFSGLSGVNLYNAFAISYKDNIYNLSVGSNISDVAGDCFDWSTPLPIKICVCQNACLPVAITKVK